MNSEAPKFLPYGRQTIEQDDIDAVVDVLQENFLTTGPKITEFEDLLKEKTNAKEAVAVGNGTQALHLACLAIELGEGDAAIVPSLTFLATANAVRYCGADVIFCDVDSETGLMTPEHLQKALDNNQDKNIKAVLPVHLTGQCVDLKSIREIANKNNLKIITDSCHALGSQHGNHTIGDCAYEDLCTFSFHPVKNIAMGEGGAITTNNKDMADKIQSLRSHGMVPQPKNGPWAYKVDEIGFNYRVTDIQCALGVSQLKKLNLFILKRRELVALYDEVLKSLAPIVQPPIRVSDCDPAWHLYAVRIDFKQAGMTRGQFMNALKERGIGTQVHYIPVHTQPYYQELYGEQDLPGAMAYYEQTLSLPLFPLMEKEDVERVIQEMKLILG